MSTRQIFYAILSLIVFLGACSSEKTVPEKTHLGGCILISPLGEVPDNLYMNSGIVPTDEYKPFTKKLTVCGITMVGRDDISDDFMRRVAKTITEVFPHGSTIDDALQKEVLRNMYKYRALIPLYKGRDRDFSHAEKAAWDNTRSQNSVCDIIMELEPGTGQVNEVVEHILHWVTDVGLHYTFPDEWGISETSKLYQAMREAVDNKYYYRGRSGQIENEDPERRERRLRVTLQEFAYWFIFTAWNLMEPYGPKGEEWTIKNRSDLKAKLPQLYEVYEQTVVKVMALPNLSTLEEFMN